MVEYRKLIPGDLPGLAEIIWKKWAPPEVRRHPIFARQFGYLVLSWFAGKHDLSWVAADPETGEPLGVLLTEISGFSEPNTLIWERKRITDACDRVLTSAGIDIKGNAEDFDRNSRVMHEAFGGREPGAELLLFALAEKARGKGVGRDLFDLTMKSLKAAGVEDFYLHSDNSSSYGFYDHRFITRIAETSSDICMGDMTNVDLYLYSDTVGNQICHINSRHAEGQGPGEH